MTALSGLIAQYKHSRGYDFTPTPDTLAKLGVVSDGKPSMRLWRKIERGEVDPTNTVALAIVEWLGYTPDDLKKGSSYLVTGHDLRNIMDMAGMQQVQS